ncbi:hypothetical protein [Oligoflexus tunisiensis]|uniref:hypothetical protein n=1 Tax=Oligoflexus tunisiensis TaxID=708132 RepID=UPI00114CC0EE|nr:hypothetical protein [Oligoflexus tunisiensis]
MLKNFPSLIGIFRLIFSQIWFLSNHDWLVLAILPQRFNRISKWIVSRTHGIKIYSNFLRNDSSTLNAEYTAARALLRSFQANLSQSKKNVSPDFSNEQIVKVFEATWLDSIRWSISLCNSLREENLNRKVYIYMPHSVGLLFLSELLRFMLATSLRFVKKYGKRFWNFINIFPQRIDYYFSKSSFILSILKTDREKSRNPYKKQTTLNIRNRFFSFPSKSSSSQEVKNSHKRQAIWERINRFFSTAPKTSSCQIPNADLLLCLIDSDTDLNFDAAKNLLRELTANQSTILLPFGCDTRKLSMIRSIAPNINHIEFQVPDRPTFSRYRVASTFLKVLSQSMESYSKHERRVMLKYCSSTAYFVACFLEREVMFLKQTLKKYSQVKGCFMVPDAHPVNRLLCMLLENKGVPTFTIDTCMLAGFDAAGEATCDYTFVSGKWNKEIYDKSRRASGKKVLITGAPRYESIYFKMPEAFNKRLIYCTENSGLERTIGICRQLANLKNIEKVEIWPHPAEPQTELLEAIESINAKAEASKLFAVMRNQRDWSNCHGSLVLVEHSTIGIEMSLRGCFVMSYNPLRSMFNPYANTATVPMLIDISEIDSYAEKILLSENHFFEILKLQTAEVSDLFNKRPADVQPSQAIARLIANAQINWLNAE